MHGHGVPLVRAGRSAVRSRSAGHAAPQKQACLDGGGGSGGGGGGGGGGHDIDGDHESDVSTRQRKINIYGSRVRP